MVEIGAGSKAESGMEVRNADSRYRNADGGWRIAECGWRIADSGMGIVENAKSGPVIIWDLSAPENTVDTALQISRPKAPGSVLRKRIMGGVGICESLKFKTLMHSCSLFYITFTHDPRFPLCQHPPVE